MNSAGFNFIITWGLWILGIGIILVIGVLWCLDVNHKLRYILSRLGDTGPGKDSEFFAGTKNLAPSAAPAGSIPPLVAVGIVGIAILLLFIIPVWLINK